MTADALFEADTLREHEELEYVRGHKAGFWGLVYNDSASSHWRRGYTDGRSDAEEAYYNSASEVYGSS